MTVCTFNSSFDFGNEHFLDIVLYCSNYFDDIEETLSGMALHSGTGCPDISVMESLNTFWKNTPEVKPQELDHIDRFGESLVRANVVSANRTEQNRTEQNRTEQNRTEQNRTEQNRLGITP